MKLKKGFFIRELKNRFRGEAKIGGRSFLCHIPSSCKLSNFLDLNNRPALFVDIIKSSKKIRYGLYAVQYLDSYVVLNSSMANKAVLNSINGRFFYFIKDRLNAIAEQNIEGYKTDIYLPESKTILEIKSVICEGDFAVFPKVYSERAIKQLKRLLLLQKKGYSVCYIIVSLNPFIKTIKIDRNQPIYKYLKKCIDNGMILKAFAARQYYNKLRISKVVNIKL